MDRRRQQRLWVGFLVCVAGFTPGAAWAAADDAAARIETLEQENAALREQNRALQEAVDQARRELEQLRTPPPPPEVATEVAEARPAAAEVDQLREENQQLQQELAQVREQTEDLEVEKQQLEQLAGMTPKGLLIESDIAQAKSYFDADRDVTVVRSEPRPILEAKKAGFTEHALAASFSYPGQEMTEPPATLTVELLTENNPTSRYEHFKTATLLIDQEPVEIPVTGYEMLSRTRSPVRPGSSTARRTETRDEMIRFDIDGDLLRRIARANLLVLELPNLTLPLGRDHIAMFEMMRARMNMTGQDAGE